MKKDVYVDKSLTNKKSWSRPKKIFIGILGVLFVVGLVYGIISYYSSENEEISYSSLERDTPTILQKIKQSLLGWDAVMKAYILVIGILGVGIVVFLLLRELVLWYWRLNHIVERLDIIIYLLKERREDRERQEKTGAVEEKAEETIRTARAAEKGGQRPHNSA